MLWKNAVSTFWDIACPQQSLCRAGRKDTGTSSWRGIGPSHGVLRKNSIRWQQLRARYLLNNNIVTAERALLPEGQYQSRASAHPPQCLPGIVAPTTMSLSFTATTGRGPRPTKFCEPHFRSDRRRASHSQPQSPCPIQKTSQTRADQNRGGNEPRTSLSQLTRDLCLILKSKGVVARKLIEGDRLVSGEPLDVVRH
jgi:hypothetical protein